LLGTTFGLNGEFGEKSSIALFLGMFFMFLPSLPHDYILKSIGHVDRVASLLGEHDIMVPHVGVVTDLRVVVNLHRMDQFMHDRVRKLLTVLELVGQTEQDTLGCLVAGDAITPDGILELDVNVDELKGKLSLEHGFVDSAHESTSRLFGSDHHEPMMPDFC